MKAFIDDLQLIRIESIEYIYDIRINGYEISWYKNQEQNQYFKSNKEIDLHIADTIYINHHAYPLNIGLVTLKNSFEKKYRYDGPLGAVYTKESTKFYVYSPVAKEVFVLVDDKAYPMTYLEGGTWFREVLGNLEDKTYIYNVRLVDQFVLAKDPYTLASDLNNSVIINPEKLYKQKTEHIKLNKYTDAVIYEGMIRDLTIDLDVEDKGTFLGVTQHSNKLGQSVLSYIKNLGMTHFQVLPVYDFYGVDDINKDLYYNWGYNPMQYFALEGWLSKDPNNPYTRINEFRYLVDTAHDLGLGVNMDVVYNHVYERSLFPYDLFVPGYFYRHDKHYKQTHSAFLENDIETTNYMVRRLIIDSLIHFVKNYKIDGFRFDLMGLMDVDTMNEIERVLRKINPNIMLYGEGWNMDNALPKIKRSNMSNQALMKNIGHFNDFYRNLFKGELHTKNLGFATGSKKHLKDVLQALLGSPHIFDTPNKSLNYVECHDNLTLFDTLAFNYDDIKVKQIYQDFANHVIAISQGVPFYHAGQELYRSKKGVENSYKSPDDINQIKWDIPKSVEKFNQILKLRKSYKVYRYDFYNNENIDVFLGHEYITYVLKSKTYELTHYLKNDFKEISIPNNGKMIFSSQLVSKKSDQYILSKPGVYIIKRKV
ncbi:alpha-amylase family glycosyl hydrolase [Acholeplasma granularum]|uniref:alpha-amylase family glycosyl hydrolase n=1 Tax=Acholeplasma granularum TaxID=264635 RepID=UPI0004BC02ED|nr:alpha-amylase family glycosyl hydrolase [Acholeplasma granularum]